MKTLRIILAMLAASLLLMGCDQITGDSSSGGGVNGTSWYGTYEAPDGSLDTLLVEFDGSGNISKVVIGTVDQNYTAEVSKVQRNIYGFTGNDGYDGGFILNGNHAVFLTEEFKFGAVQKNADALAASYGQADVVGTWSGDMVQLDAGFNLLSVEDSSTTVSSDGSFTGTYGTDGSFKQNANLTLDSSIYGRYFGEVYDNGDGTTSDIDVILTPDKQAAATWGCYPAGGGYFFPEGCSFFAWD